MTMPAEFGFLSLIPAGITIVVALVWRRVAVALGCGVAAGALVAGKLHPLAAGKALGGALWAAISDPERLKIVLFILLVGGLLEVIAASGAYQAFAEAVVRRLPNARRTRLATWALSACLFFDDYANVLITGSSMRKVAQRNGVRPAMMAYLVDVVAVLASVTLISTWATFEGSEMARAAQGVGLSRGASELFLGSLPYHFYTYLAIFLTFLVAVSGRWFGARLDTHRFLAMQEPEAAEGASAAQVIAPLLTLILGAILGLFGAGTWRLFGSGEPFSLMGALRQAPAVDVLIGATVAALGVAAWLLRSCGQRQRPALRPAFGRGVRDMLEIGVIILLATALSKISTELGAGVFLASGFTHALPGQLVPLGVFTLSMLVTVCTGFSWGAMAIVMPVAYSLAATQGGIAIPLMSAAVVTGAVSGEHLIPYSEKVVLSAAACGIPPLYHFKTQLPQSLAAFLAAGLGFALAGHGWPLGLAYGLPVALLVLVHVSLARTEASGGQ
jgi:Na+/H+ antiporter NhaC